MLTQVDWGCAIKQRTANDMTLASGPSSSSHPSAWPASNEMHGHPHSSTPTYKLCQAINPNDAAANGVSSWASSSGKVHSVAARACNLNYSDDSTHIHVSQQMIPDQLPASFLAHSPVSSEISAQLPSSACSPVLVPCSGAAQTPSKSQKTCLSPFPLAAPSFTSLYNANIGTASSCGLQPLQQFQSESVRQFGQQAILAAMTTPIQQALQSGYTDGRNGPTIATINNGNLCTSNIIRAQPLQLQSLPLAAALSPTWGASQMMGLSVNSIARQVPENAAAVYSATIGNPTNAAAGRDTSCSGLSSGGAVLQGGVMSTWGSSSGSGSGSLFDGAGTICGGNGNMVSMSQIKQMFDEDDESASARQLGLCLRRGEGPGGAQSVMSLGAEYGSIGPNSNKNRDAQRRFRQRQRAQFEALGSKVRQQEEQLQALKREKRMVEQHNEVLLRQLRRYEQEAAEGQRPFPGTTPRNEVEQQQNVGQQNGQDGESASLHSSYRCLRCGSAVMSPLTLPQH